MASPPAAHLLLLGAPGRPFTDWNCSEMVMSLVNKLEMTGRNLAVHRRGTRRHFRALWGWQSVHTENTEKACALRVGGFDTRRMRRELTQQGAWGRVEP